jgi:fatty acid desaturase
MKSQSLSALGYLSIFLMPVLLLAGAVMDMHWLAFAAVVLVFPAARLAFGAFPAMVPDWREGIATFLDRLPLAYVPILAMSMLGSLLVLSEQAQGPAAWIGYGLSLWMTLLFGICVAHELIHRRQAGEALAGSILAGICGYPVLSAEHLAHHSRPGDMERAEYPRADESVWRFAQQRLSRIAQEFLGRGATIWSGRSRSSTARRLRRAMATTAIAAGGVAISAGVAGLVMYAAVSLGVAFGVQIITYIQHWGLADDEARVGHGRGWEEDCRFQAWITLNISLHDVHHLESRLPYYRLAMATDSPRLPAGYVVLMFTSLVPSLWFHLMRPALEHWHRQPQAPVSAGRRLTCFGLY